MLFYFPINLCVQPIYNAIAIFIDDLSIKIIYTIESHVYSSEFPPVTAEIIRLCAVAIVFKC